MTSGNGQRGVRTNMYTYTFTSVGGPLISAAVHGNWVGSVWVFGCLGVWAVYVFVCVGIWVFGSLGAWVFVCVGVWVLGCL